MVSQWRSLRVLKKGLSMLSLVIKVRKPSLFSGPALPPASLLQKPCYNNTNFFPLLGKKLMFSNWVQQATQAPETCKNQGSARLITIQNEADYRFMDIWRGIIICINNYPVIIRACMHLTKFPIAHGDCLLLSILGASNIFFRRA